MELQPSTSQHTTLKLTVLSTIRFSRITGTFPHFHRSTKSNSFASAETDRMHGSQLVVLAVLGQPQQMLPHLEDSDLIQSIPLYLSGREWISVDFGHCRSIKYHKDVR